MIESKFYDQYCCFIVIFYNVITMEVFLEIPKKDSAHLMYILLHTNIKYAIIL